MKAAAEIKQKQTNTDGESVAVQRQGPREGAGSASVSGWNMTGGASLRVGEADRDAGAEETTPLLHCCVED